MENKMFSQMSQIEREGILARALLKKVKGHFTVAEIRSIVKALDLSVQYNIVVVNDAKEFAKTATLSDHSSKHSLVGDTLTKGEGYDLLEKGMVFGCNYTYVYCDNGEMTACESEKSVPDFNIAEKQAIVVYEHDFSNYNGQNWDIWKNTIAIYIPEGEPYKVDPEIQKIIDLLGLN